MPTSIGEPMSATSLEQKGRYRQNSNRYPITTESILAEVESDIAILDDETIALLKKSPYYEPSSAKK